jgi:hypothetical protein
MDGLSLARVIAGFLSASADATVSGEEPKVRDGPSHYCLAAVLRPDF